MNQDAFFSNPLRTSYREYLDRGFYLRWRMVQLQTKVAHYEDFRHDWDEYDRIRTEVLTWLASEPLARFYDTGSRVYFESRADAIRFKLVFG